MTKVGKWDARRTVPQQIGVCEGEILRATDKGLQSDSISREGGEIDAWCMAWRDEHSAKAGLPLNWTRGSP